MDYLIGRTTCITVLDIAGAALARARARLGTAQERVTWIEADVTADWQVRPVDIWHDRAVFHFLTEAADRARYRAHLQRDLRRGGTLIMATFAPEGPGRCSGLHVVRYSPDALAAELGPEFRLHESISETHPTPFGTSQAFWYNRFTREGRT